MSEEDSNSFQESDSWFGEDRGQSEYEELAEEFPNARNLAGAEEARLHQPLLAKAKHDGDTADADDSQTSHEDAVELPEPDPYSGDSFTVFDYASDEYADADTLGDAIAMRGRKAFFEKVMPEDFLPTAEGVSRLGIASLWSQSTWSDDEDDERDIEEEQTVAAVDEGDVLTLGQVPRDLPSGQNMLEVQDLGYGFYLHGRLLPFTPYNDYDQDNFADAIKSLSPGEWIECVVRNASCTGEDGVPKAPDFCWRVYSCDVTVYKVRA